MWLRVSASTANLSNFNAEMRQLHVAWKSSIIDILAHQFVIYFNAKFISSLSYVLNDWDLLEWCDVMVS